MVRLRRGCTLLSLTVLWGCATTRITDTPRTASEQLLISHAVDRAMSRVDFSPLAGRAVFLQEKYLDGIDKNYVAASVRHRLLMAGARLMDKEADAEVIVELRSGGVGTDRAESYVGTPRVELPGILPVQIPDLQFATSKRQTAIAKIGIVAYDAKTRQALGTGGVVLASSDDNNWFVLGVGPFRSGALHEELKRTTAYSQLPMDVVGILPFRRGEEEPTAFPDEPTFVPLSASPTPSPAAMGQQPTFTSPVPPGSMPPPYGIAPSGFPQVAPPPVPASP